MTNIDEPVIDLLKSSYNKMYKSSSIVLLLFLNGTNNIKIKSTLFKISSSYIFFIPANTDFSITGDGEVYILSITEIVVNKILNRSISISIKSYFRDKQDKNNVSMFNINNIKSQFNYFFKEILTELKTKQNNYIEVNELHILEILFRLKRVGILTSDQMNRLSADSFIWSISDVIHYVKENFDGQFTLNELAGKCALNSSYFSRTFKQEVGIPLFEYINRLRVEKACHLLKISNSSIIEIAFSVGYNNVTFFNRYFKKIMNISPGEYRSRIKK